MASRDHIVGLSGILLAVLGAILVAEQRHHKCAKIASGHPPADAARAADESQFLSAVRNRPTRSLSTEGRNKIASIAS
jgi:hypothetical protein